jgi:hypothetical protein
LRHRNQAAAKRRQSALAGKVKEISNMMDVIVLAIGIAFFALSIAYAYACERL